MPVNGHRRRTGPMHGDIELRSYADSEGRAFQFALRQCPGASGLVVHFSAFFDRDDIPRPPRTSRRPLDSDDPDFAGYFHRLHMLGSSDRHNWLFVCDPYGAKRNGTFYTGEGGDLYVERAMSAIVAEVWSQLGVGPEETIVAGSSAGATGAIKLAITHAVRGIVAIAPVIDLDTYVTHCGRYEEVAFACPDGKPLAEHNRRYTRQIRALVESAESLPALFVQSCADDAGIHQEQVLPFVESWGAKGGDVWLDVRSTGGHSSKYATGPVLHDVIDRLFAQRDIDVLRYQRSRRFRPRRAPISQTLLDQARLLPSRVSRLPGMRGAVAAAHLQRYTRSIAKRLQDL